MSCGCGHESSDPMIHQFDLAALTSLQASAAAEMTQEFSTQQIWLIEGQPTVATGTADGKKGCVTVPIFGIPLKLCWEIREVDPFPPEVSIRVRFSVSHNGSEYFSVILLMKCEDVLNPSTCSVTVESENVLMEAYRPSCNWSCLRRCAPGCIRCGTNYWCWAACAGACVLRCCRV
ncbi:hypothetical protein Pan216_09650 [Planctomycetes bacterium Pan216]|uniref:Uncharacterized protein n=1 Tax=Kolteria novifilia TaxID=2527975 RepID=A0A518AZE0_9BACT|nr:hypothetical protein Pan216_09650 [Planctomycetes bacterium Pan216]